MTLPECGFTAPEGTYFKGWAFDANSTEVVQFKSFEVSGGGTTLYAIWSDITYIDSVDVTIQEPVAGAEPQDAVSNTEGVSVSTTEWYHNGTKLSASDTFAAGVSYRVFVSVSADSGYAFADNVTLTFNGSKEGIFDGSNNGQLTYVAEFTAINPSKSISVKDIQNGDTLKFKVDLKSDETITGIIIATVYDNDGKFIAVKQSNAASEVSFIFSDVKNAATIKVFWWNGIGSMMPQAKNVTVSL